MIINTKIVLKDLAGKEILDENKEVFTFGQALANIVVSAKEGGKMKLFLLGTKLFQNDKVEVDEADLTLLKSVVKSTEVYGALIAGQCEQLLEEVKK
jgi:hypothetical protein